ncbi:MAG: hypothetical protein RMK29_14600 [Myxococcales bacterium]|nr:hypothetical protein [Myxococcota bacterium]MDW8282942.1 hypothetical protein [Myxococcales bacterium]
MVLRSASVRELEPALARVAGPQFQRTATRPVVLEVRTAEPIDPTPRTCLPLIVLNGRVLPNTYARIEAPDQLLAFLPDRKLLRSVNQVWVVWAGNERQTASPHPLQLEVRGKDD